MDILSKITPEEFLQNEQEFLKALKSEENLAKLPFINHVDVQNLKDNTLVRFRGMVQDMSDPEFYLEKYAVVNGDSLHFQNGRLRDAFVLKNDENIDSENSENSHGERRSIFVVTIPGFNQWAENSEREIYDIKGDTSAQQIVSPLKRQLDDGGEMESENSKQKSRNKLIGTTSNNSTNQGSSNVTVQGSSNTSVLSREYLLNSPIADRPSKACLVKIYSDFDKLVLNTVVDIVGFLSVDPVLDGTNQEISEFEEISEIQAANPPPSLIPRIHAILMEPVHHLNPLIPNAVSQETTGFDEHTSLELFKDIQLALTQCLFGDTIAAEYLMAHLISTVYVRSELESLGQFSLNISNIPQNVLPTYTSLLYDIIEMLLPASHFFPMTLDNLNLLQFSPKKDYTCNKLISGLLQLAPHTHLVLDETQLQTGKLENNGVRGVSSIAFLINNQKVKCDFQFFDIELNVDIPVLVLSEGKSMLPSNCHVPLKVQVDNTDMIKETFEAAKFYLRPKLNLIRRYLTTLRIVNFNMNPEELTMIENDFVEMRRESRATPDELHSLIVLSRLIALCRGKTCMNSDLWQHAKSLETERKKRVMSTVSKKSPPGNGF